MSIEKPKLADRVAAVRDLRIIFGSDPGLDAAIETLDDAQARITELEAALRAVEWLRDIEEQPGGFDYCPACGACRINGHDEGCSLSKALAGGES